MSRKVELTPHNPDWRKDYEAEAARLTAVLEPELVAIHHIGSTAVPGIKAKPIIDILVEVRNIEQVDTYNQAMADLGYDAKGENGIEGRRYFRKGSDLHHTHHIHTFQSDHPEIGRHLNFRDYLIAHPAVAQAYSRLKEELSRKYFTDPRHYTSNKAAFVESALEKAAAWRSGQGQRVETERLCLLPLTAWQLEAGLDNPESLGRELGVAVPPAIFEDPVPRAIGMKLAKMAEADPAAHHWYTYWLIIIVRENVGAGLVGFKGAPDEQGEVEIGYGLAPAFQNQGYMTEAVQALVAWALKQPDCTAVTTWTDLTNQPSIRVLEKVGLTKIAEKDGRIFWRIAVDGS